MRRLASLTLALVLLGGADKPAAKDPAKLQGSWVVVSAQRDGKAADDLKGHQLTLAGDKFVIKSRDGKLLYQGTYQVDTSRKPATIDFRHTEGALKGKTWKGIFALEGDTLKESDNAPNPDRDRPKDFKAAAGSGCVAIVFKRTGG
jgi:uncharacterized protein (TIGR03067 family)